MYILSEDQEALDKLKAALEEIRKLYWKAAEQYFIENPAALEVFERGTK